MLAGMPVLRLSLACWDESFAWLTKPRWDLMSTGGYEGMRFALFVVDYASWSSIALWVWLEADRIRVRVSYCPVRALIPGPAGFWRTGFALLIGRPTPTCCVTSCLISFAEVFVFLNWADEEVIRC